MLKSIDIVEKVFTFTPLNQLELKTVKTLNELKETLEYLECMQLKRCNPNTQEKISTAMREVTFQIDEIEQINADANRFNRIKPLTPYQLFDFNQIGF